MYMYVYTHIYIYIYIYTCVHIYIYTRTCKRDRCANHALHILSSSEAKHHQDFPRPHFQSFNMQPSFRSPPLREVKRVQFFQPIP